MTAADYEVLGTVIARAVQAATVPLLAKIAALEARGLVPGPMGPAGANGRDGRDGMAGPVGPVGAKGLDGKDGTPGPTGKDGAPGPMGAKGLDGKDGAAGLAGKDGAQGLHGKDGRDGLGFEDLDLVLEADKGLLLRVTAGERVKEWPLPCPIDFGVWTAGRVYPKGAGVTHDGAWWIAQTVTSAQPGLAAAASREWRLAVRRGKDGRPGKDGKDGGDL